MRFFYIFSDFYFPFCFSLTSFFQLEKHFVCFFLFPVHSKSEKEWWVKKILNVPEERKRCWELTWLSTHSYRFFFSLFFGWKDAKVFVKPFFRKNNFYFFTCCDFTFFSFRILRKFVILGVFFIFRYEFLKNTSIFSRFWLAFSI